ncbi:MAG: hypothetical protein Q8K65_09510 [Alphaproteobacteria bacterium]|nr:hypothetical protein [Alphaproteobacteria bacterium]
MNVLWREYKAGARKNPLYALKTKRKFFYLPPIPSALRESARLGGKILPIDKNSLHIRAGQTAFAKYPQRLHIFQMLPYNRRIGASGRALIHLIVVKF